jgi:hypothetical protein
VQAVLEDVAVMLLPPLLDKLEFIRRFYEITSEPFVETKRKIDQHEEPFSNFDVEDGEPPFLLEWEEADQSLNVLGKSCLCLLQNSFTNYLKAFIQHYAPVDENVTLENVGSNGLERYRRVFWGRFNIDWVTSPVDVDALEEINLARNDIQHGGTFYNLEHRQDDKYFDRFPDSIFADEFERGLVPAAGAAQPYRITVSKANLLAAIKSVEDFCAYLDNEWWKVNA